MPLKESVPRCRFRAPGSLRRSCEEDRRPKVLLAHADAGYRVRARRQFIDGDVRLVTAASADEVYRLAWQLRPQLIVLDARLPDESGYLACAKIKLDSPDCQVVVLTDEHGEAERFAQFAGADGVSERSPDPERLADMAF